MEDDKIEDNRNNSQIMQGNKIAWGDKIEKNEMGWACGAYG